MFDLKAFIKTNIVNGIKNGTFSKEYGNIMAVNYLTKGLLVEEDIASIDAEISAWELSQTNAVDVEVNTEEITEPETEVEEATEEEAEATPTEEQEGDA